MSVTITQNRLTALLSSWKQLLQAWSADGRLSSAAEEALLLGVKPEQLVLPAGQWAAAMPDTITSSADVIAARSGNDEIRLTQAQLATIATTAGASVDGGTEAGTLLLTEATNALVDANFTSVSNIETLKLTGANIIELGANAAAAGINTIVLGNDDTSITLNDGVSMTVDAAALPDNKTLTIAGDGSFTINNLLGDLISTAATGTVAIPLNGNGTAVSTSITNNGGAASFTVNSGTMGADDTINFFGAEIITAIAAALSLNLNSLGSAAATVDAAAMADNDNLSVSGKGAYTVTGLTANLINTGTLEDDTTDVSSSTTITKNAGSGSVTVKTGSFDSGDAIVLSGSNAIDVNATDSVNITTGSASTSISESTGNTAVVDAAAMSDDNLLAISGDGDQENSRLITHLTSSSSGTLSITLEDDGINNVSTTITNNAVATGFTVNTGSFDADDTIVLAGSNAINVVAVDSVNIITGSASASISQVGGKTATVNAALLADNSLLTTSGAGNFTVNNLLGDLTNTATGTVALTLDVNTSTGTVDTTITNNAGSGTFKVANGSFASGDTINLAGTGAITVNGLVANVDASTSTGNITTNAVADVSITTGSANTTISETDGNTATVNATALADNNTLTISGDGNQTITGLQADLSSTADGGVINITTADVADQTIDLGSGTRGTRRVDATAMADNNSLTLIGSGAATLTVNDADVDASSYAGNLTVDASGGANASTITTGSGTDSISLTQPQLVTTTIDGGDGEDTLLISAATANIIDSDFTNITGVETLQITGTSTAELGRAANAAGIAKVKVGNENTTIKLTNGIAITIDASLMDEIYTLTLDGDGDFTITDLVANLDASLCTGTVIESIANEVAQTIGFGRVTDGKSLTYSSNKDIITGGFGSNDITGGFGSDSIIAGGGGNTMTGGAVGAGFNNAVDTFDFTSTRSGTTSALATDVATGFEAADEISDFFGPGSASNTMISGTPFASLSDLLV